MFKCSMRLRPLLGCWQSFQLAYSKVAILVGNMSNQATSLKRRVIRGLGGPWGWRVVVALFLLEALWFVFSARYPMAFDENYHFGLIKLHAAQWLPYFTSQPPNASAYGAVVREPSYLYHWLMSFPYRLISVFTHSQTALVICLRLLNVAMFSYGLVLSRRVVQIMGVSRALANCLFAMFVLIPVVPFLAAHINYDNMFFVAVSATALLALRLMDEFKRREVNARTLLELAAVLLLSSLVKYPYLPVLMVTLALVGWQLRASGLFGRAGLRAFQQSFQAVSKVTSVSLVLLCLLSFGLFAERYVGNMVRYHNPVPACDVVISEDECSQYGPYGRDRLDIKAKPASFHPSPAVYIWQWVYGMWYRLFFAINYDYTTAPPLLVISVLAVAGAAFVLVGVVLRFRALFASQPTRQFVLLLIIGYTLTLFLDGFRSYARTGQPVAINGRYLIPFLPFLFAFGGLAWSQLLRQRESYKLAVASAVLAVLVLQGGGTMTYIVRSQDSWFWPNSAVVRVNRAVRSMAWPLIVGKKIW